MSNKVAEIIVERLIEKIKTDNKLPWQKNFLETCNNYYTGKSYRGINRYLLEGKQWITYNQLKEYNKKNKTSFYIPSGSEKSYCTFYQMTEKKISDEDAELIYSGSIPEKYLFVKIVEKDDGLYYQKFLLKYYLVYNIENIVDNDGNHLPQKNCCDFEEHSTADEVVARYCKYSGCKIRNDGDKCLYRDSTDTVFTVPQNHFASTEAYYRTLFHELGHSTGIEKRLHRASFKQYAKTTERSKEELVAEIVSLLLATECGFSDEFETTNSDNYILDWIEYLENNPKQVVNAMLNAEKATDFILNIEQHTGGVKYE